MKRSTASGEHPWLAREAADRLLGAESSEQLADMLARAVVAAGVQWCVAAVGRMHAVRVIAEYGPAPPVPGILRVLSGGRSGQLSLELSPVYPSYVTSTEDIVFALITSEQNATTDLLWHAGRAMLEGLVQRQRCRALEIQLAQRTHMLETIFELVRDASVETSRERLLHIAGLRLMAHAATSRVFIALFEGEELAHLWTRGVVLDAAVGRALPRDLLVPHSSEELSGAASQWLQAERIAMLAPIALRERVLGVVGIGARSDGRQQQLDDAFLTAYLNALAVAIEQLALLERFVEQERIERELALARAVQQRLLPSLERMYKPGGVEIAARIEPARHVSGDYFDVIERNGSIICTIADVCGKGMAAALIMAHLHAAFHLLGSQHASPAEGFASGIVSLFVTRSQVHSLPLPSSSSTLRVTRCGTPMRGIRTHLCSRQAATLRCSIAAGWYSVSSKMFTTKSMFSNFCREVSCVSTPTESVKRSVSILQSSALGVSARSSKSMLLHHWTVWSNPSLAQWHRCKRLKLHLMIEQLFFSDWQRHDCAVGRNLA